jgi:hypothetical protein
MWTLNDSARSVEPSPAKKDGRPTILKPDLWAFHGVELLGAAIEHSGFPAGSLPRTIDPHQT